MGYLLLFLSPSMILFAVGLHVVGGVWLALWIGTGLWGIRNFPRVRTAAPAPPEDQSL